MRKKKSSKKLALNRETLKILAEVELWQVGGANPSNLRGTWCVQCTPDVPPTYSCDALCD